MVDTGTACLYQVDIILDRTGPLKMALLTIKKKKHTQMEKRVSANAESKFKFEYMEVYFLFRNYLKPLELPKTVPHYLTNAPGQVGHL